MLDEQSSKAPKAASLTQLFSHAEPLDYVLMFFGSIGGIVTGLSIPFIEVLFGRMLDNLNGNPENFSHEIAKLCISFTVLGAANLVSGWLQVSLWTWSGERQAHKHREKYVKAILSQEIGWFDTIGAGELSTKVADLTGKMQGIQTSTAIYCWCRPFNVVLFSSDGIGRKIGDLIQYASQVIFAFIVAFYFNWKLTLVLLTSFPLIAGAGAFMIRAITAATVHFIIIFCHRCWLF